MGFFIFGVFFFHGWYGHSWAELDHRQHVIAVYSAISAVLYPFAYFVVDGLGTRYMPNFWQQQYHGEDALKFFQVIIPAGCFFIAIPLAFFAPFMRKNKKVRKS